MSLRKRSGIKVVKVIHEDVAHLFYLSEETDWPAFEAQVYAKFKIESPIIIYFYNLEGERKISCCDQDFKDFFRDINTTSHVKVLSCLETDEPFMADETEVLEEKSPEIETLKYPERATATLPEASITPASDTASYRCDHFQNEEESSPCIFSLSEFGDTSSFEEKLSESEMLKYAEQAPTVILETNINPVSDTASYGCNFSRNIKASGHCISSISESDSTSSLEENHLGNRGAKDIDKSQAIMFDAFIDPVSDATSHDYDSSQNLETSGPSLSFRKSDEKISLEKKGLKKECSEYIDSVSAKVFKSFINPVSDTAHERGSSQKEKASSSCISYAAKYEDLSDESNMTERCSFTTRTCREVGYSLRTVSWVTLVLAASFFIVIISARLYERNTLRIVQGVEYQSYKLFGIRFRYYQAFSYKLRCLIIHKLYICV